MRIRQVKKTGSGTYNTMGSKYGVIHLIVFHRLKFEVTPLQEVTPYVGSTVNFSCVAKSDLRPVITWETDIKSRVLVDSNIRPNGTLVLYNRNPIKERIPALRRMPWQQLLLKSKSILRD